MEEKLTIKKAFWTFVIASLVGCVWEVFNHFMHYGNFVSRSALIYGPFNPIYGVGAVIFLIFLSKFKNPFKIFLGGALIGGGFEYLASLLQEQIFGTISWDYSTQPLNINGRTGIFYMVCWGLAAVVFIKTVYPIISRAVDNMSSKSGNVITIIFVIFMLINTVISVMACLREQERFLNKEPKNGIDRFLDKHYPDERLDKIYENHKRTKNR